VVEIEICLEDTSGGGETSTILVQVQSRLANMTVQLQDMENMKVVHENVWCTMYQSECHCMSYNGKYLEMGASNPFLTRSQMKWCEIYIKWGHMPPHLLTLEKYQKNHHTPFCEFCKSMGNDVKNRRSLQLI
jgi:hypothetical protein